MKVKEHYSASAHYEVPETSNGNVYRISGEIRNDGELVFSGGYNKPGDGSTYNCVEYRTKKIDALELATFIEELPAVVQMPMHSLVSRICTVYRYIAVD